MYERFFGLVDAPFRLTPDPRYLFLSRKHADALAHLRLGLTESSGFVCITGDVGTGKTTLLRTFLTELGPDVATAYVLSPTLSVLELLRTIVAEFGLASGSRSRKKLVDVLNAHLLALHVAGRRAVLVIDEAQALSVAVLEELRLLSNLETTTEKLLRIVLVGQPELRALLVLPSLVQLNQRITLRWHMGPLTRRETFAYVRHRLAVASEGQAGPVFTRPALWLVHRLSGGVPRLVNMIAHRSLLAAFAADRRTVRARSVLRAYREIEAVPLPVAPPSRRRAAWSTLAAGVVLGAVALGAGRIAWDPAPEPPAQEASIAADVAVAPEPVPEEVAAVEAPAAEAPAPDETPPPPPGEPEFVGPPAPDEPGLDVRLAALAPDASARAAVNAVLGTWAAPPLAANEAATPAGLVTAAQKRGLEHVALVGNATLLRLLNLPAILEVRLPESGEVRWVAVTAMRDGEWVLALDDAGATVDPGALERLWLGQAHLLWRDFESLGAGALDQHARGVTVARLQQLLHRAGAFHGAATGQYGPSTAAAVLEFQRRHFLLADARVGPLTRIVLYSAAGGYPAPALAVPGGDRS
jgi:general secretion pathway protein A